jgi:hypothetical protein
MRSTTKSRARHIPQKPALSFCTWSLKGRSLPGVGTGGRQLVQHATSIGDGAHAFPSQTAHPNRVCCRARSTNINVEAGNRPSGAAKPTPQKSAIDTAKLHFTDYIGDWSLNGKHQIAMVVSARQRRRFLKARPGLQIIDNRAARKGAARGVPFTPAASTPRRRSASYASACQSRQRSRWRPRGRSPRFRVRPSRPAAPNFGRYAPRSRALR